MNILALTSIIILFASELYCQKSEYIFERKHKESAADFVERHLNEHCLMSHQVLEGYWGDESKGKKILVLYECSIKDESNNGSLIVFQPIGDEKNYLLMSIDLDLVGIFKDQIESVFYLDANNDGTKELFVLKKGIEKTPVIMEEIDEQGITTKHHTTACCKDIYRTKIIEQIKYFDGEFLPLIETSSIEYECDFDDLKTANEVKAKLKEYLENQK